MPVAVGISGQLISELDCTMSLMAFPRLRMATPAVTTGTGNWHQNSDSLAGLNATRQPYTLNLARAADVQGTNASWTLPSAAEVIESKLHPRLMASSRSSLIRVTGTHSRWRRRFRRSAIYARSPLRQERRPMIIPQATRPEVVAM